MPIFDMTAMGKRIKEQRKALGLTQQDIYEKIDVSQNHYSRIENGHVGVSLEVLVQLSDILNISVDYILTGHISEDKLPEFALKYSQLSDKQKNYINNQINTLLEYDLK